MERQIHHALCIEAEQEAGIAWVREHIEHTLGIPMQGNPDVEVIACERYTIDHARYLKQRASQAPMGDAQVFVLVCETILHEAQNALLKLLEEPAPQTYIILVLPSQKELLPTIRSRIHFHGRVHSACEEGVLATAFLKAPIGERLSMIRPILEDKDRKKARLFLESLEHELHGNDPRKNYAALREVVFVRQYLKDRSSSLKMLLEHIAVTI